MNKIFIILVVSITFSSCSALNTIYLGGEVKNISANKNDIRPVSISFANGDDAWKWVSENIEYADDHGKYWQSPQETIERKKGICRDYATLLLVLLRNCGETDIKFCSINLDNNVRHAIIKWNGQFIEPIKYRQVYNITDDMVEAFYSVDEILDVCAVNGARSIIMNGDFD